MNENPQICLNFNVTFFSIYEHKMEVIEIATKVFDGIITLHTNYKALESDMCDVIKIRVLSISFFKGFPFPFLLSSFLFRRIFMTLHITLSSASKTNIKTSKKYLGV